MDAFPLLRNFKNQYGQASNVIFNIVFSISISKGSQKIPQVPSRTIKKKNHKIKL